MIFEVRDGSQSNLNKYLSEWQDHVVFDPKDYSLLNQRGRETYQNKQGSCVKPLDSLTQLNCTVHTWTTEASQLGCRRSLNNARLKLLTKVSLQTVHGCEEKSIDIEAEKDHQTKDYNTEQHLVLDPLLNALLPDIELQSDLSAAALLSKGDDILTQAAINKLLLSSLHLEEGHESVGERKDRWVDGELSFVDEVEHFDYHRMIE